MSLLTNTIIYNLACGEHFEQPEQKVMLNYRRSRKRFEVISCSGALVISMKAEAEARKEINDAAVNMSKAWPDTYSCWLCIAKNRISAYRKGDLTLQETLSPFYTFEERNFVRSFKPTKTSMDIGDGIRELFDKLKK